MRCRERCPQRSANIIRFCGTPGTAFPTKRKLDFYSKIKYSIPNFIGQFETILSVNKTRERDGRSALIFCCYA